MLIRSAEQAMLNGVNVKIITRKNDSIYAEKTERLLNSHCIDYAVKKKLSSSFVIIDGKAVWYSSSELFKPCEDNCVLRIEDELLASELINSL